VNRILLDINIISSVRASPPFDNDDHQVLSCMYRDRSLKMWFTISKIKKIKFL